MSAETGPRKAELIRSSLDTWCDPGYPRGKPTKQQATLNTVFSQVRFGVKRGL